MARPILAIKPGSTSTKLAVFEDERWLVSETPHRSSADLGLCPRRLDRLPVRLTAVRPRIGSRLDPSARRGASPPLAAGAMPAVGSAPDIVEIPG